jgi:hypothetical protein
VRGRKEGSEGWLLCLLDGSRQEFRWKNDTLKTEKYKAFCEYYTDK